jgi:8-oxo-dGTP pyrophosphatase MutT (NUDIX family)
MNERAAGILFYDKSLGTFLAGYQPKHGKWSGFGGHSQGDETPQQTAFREVCEELFGISPREEVLEEMIEFMNAELLSESETYTLYGLPILSIFNIPFFLQKNGYAITKYYPSFPVCLFQFLENRYNTQEAEVQKIVFFYFSELQEMKLSFTKEFYNDLLLLTNSFISN